MVPAAVVLASHPSLTAAQLEQRMGAQPNPRTLILTLQSEVQAKEQKGQEPRSKRHKL